MSRIGKRIITIPEKVEVKEEDEFIIVTGPKGTLKQKKLNGISMKIEDNNLYLERDCEENKALHGTLNSLLENMIKGVTDSFSKSLEIVGVGYRFNVQGKKLIINAGYSHPVEMQIPEGVEVKIISNTEIEVISINKQQVGEFAANIRKVRPPEPYKGKGIKYKDEHIRRKEGKKAA